jgi:hypothetical protein
MHEGLISSESYEKRSSRVIVAQVLGMVTNAVHDRENLYNDGDGEQALRAR